jgi:hypothetical protein
MRAAVGAVALTGSDQAVSAKPAIYAGFVIRETAGAVAVVRLYDNPSAASGTLIDDVALAANESAREFYPNGIWAATGIYVKIVSGAVEGSIRVA